MPDDVVAAPGAMDDFDSQLAQRAKESFDRKDDSGKFRGILKEMAGLKTWKPGEGGHMVDVIPYRAGKHDPRLPEGAASYVLDLWVHYNVGATEDSFVCSARTFSDKRNPLHLNEKCPICEYQNQLKKEENYDEDTVKALNPKRRVLYNVLVYDTPAEEDKGVQVWEVAHWSMERHLVVLSERRRGASGATVGGHIAFASPSKGKTVAFSKQGKPPNIEFLGHRFEDRDYVFDDAVLNQAKKLDEIVNIPSYEELFVSFFGHLPGEQRKAPAAVETTQKVEEDIPSNAGGEQTGLRRRQTQTQTPPAAETAVAETKTNPCPGGGIYGVDAETLDGCTSKCPEELWQACVAEKLKAAASTGTNPGRRRSLA